MITIRLSMMRTRYRAIWWNRWTAPALIGLLIVLLGGPGDTHAAIDSSGLLDNALTSFQTAAAGWATYITSRASWLFWTLAVISLVWTMGQMALRRAEAASEGNDRLGFGFVRCHGNAPLVRVDVLTSHRRWRSHSNVKGDSEDSATGRTGGRDAEE